MSNVYVCLCEFLQPLYSCFHAECIVEQARHLAITPSTYRPLLAASRQGAMLIVASPLSSVLDYVPKAMCSEYSIPIYTELKHMLQYGSSTRRHAT